jgi:hypothetical protein
LTSTKSRSNRKGKNENLGSIFCFGSRVLHFRGQEAGRILTGRARRKQKEEEALAKHLALMEELEREAETAGWKRPVPPPPPKPPTRQQAEHYESLALKWVERLWVTNNCFVAKNPFRSDKPVWTYHRGVWTNEFTRSKVDISRKPISESMPWSRIESRYSFNITDKTRKCYFERLLQNPPRRCA